jgi:hypothetical protein
MGWPVIAPEMGSFMERLAGRNWTWIVRTVEFVEIIL